LLPIRADSEKRSKKTNFVADEERVIEPVELPLGSKSNGYRDFPSETEKQRLTERFDEIFGKRYKNHYGLNLAMQQFCAHKEELLQVLDAPQLPLHTNAAEADIREYVARRKISGGTRHDDGSRP
jgi:Transposase IS66 family